MGMYFGTNQELQRWESYQTYWVISLDLWQKRQLLWKVGNLITNDLIIHVYWVAVVEADFFFQIWYSNLFLEGTIISLVHLNVIAKDETETDDWL